MNPEPGFFEDVFTPILNEKQAVFNNSKNVKLLGKPVRVRETKLFTEDASIAGKCNIMYNQERTVLNTVFFSRDNIDLLQKEIRWEVYSDSGRVISRQSDDELLIIMRSVYLQFSNTPRITNISDPKQAELIRKEVGKLNEFVRNDVVPKLLFETKQHIRYLNDVNSNIRTMERPVDQSITGTKAYRDIVSDVYMQK